MRLVTPRCLLVAAACWRRATVPLASLDPDTVDTVVRELNSVPVFAIRLVDEGTLYGTEPSCSIMYSYQYQY